MTVFDSSALLAYLMREPGVDFVRERLVDGGSCGAANWSEVAQKALADGTNWSNARDLLFSLGLTVEPVTVADAEFAARLWAKGSGLSLADRLCLALGARLGGDVITCDKQWDGRPGVILAR